MMRSSKLAVPLLCVLLLPVLATACTAAPTPAPTAVPPTPTALQMATAVPATAAPATTAPALPATTAAGPELTGASLYQLSCAACHGPDRAGNTFNQDGQTISVPALAWDDLNSMYQAQPNRGSVAQQLALAITKGQDETGDDMDSMMPRWSSLSQGQVDSLVQYLQTAGTTTGAAPTLTPDTTDLNGEQLYQVACAACHGTDGAGETFDRKGNTITTPSLHWGELTQMYSANPSRGSVAQQLALAITKGQNEMGEDLGPMMPRWSVLSQAQVDSLVQYFQTTFK